MIRAAAIQLCSSDTPLDNLEATCSLITEAAANNASLIVTPEVTNCVSTSRAHQSAVLTTQDRDPTLLAIRKLCKELSVTVVIGSLALKSETDTRFVNRSFVIGPDGDIINTYDKIHMFDVALSDTETYHESSGYAPGDSAVLSETPVGNIGLSICYDVRFPHLYRRLAHHGADILTVPAAFSVTTGQAHWDVLLRARAIENGCYVIAAAQTGTHAQQNSDPRATYGHSMIISPWGDVLSGLEADIGICYADLDLSRVKVARERVPSLLNERQFDGPIR